MPSRLQGISVAAPVTESPICCSFLLAGSPSGTSFECLLPMSSSSGVDQQRELHVSGVIHFGTSVLARVKLADFDVWRLSAGSFRCLPSFE